MEKWEPAKLKLIKTSHGELPAKLFELRGHVAKSGEGHHHHAELPPAGTFRSDKVFQLEKLLALLEEIAPQTERFKGIFQTDHPASPTASQGRRGWVRLEIANGTVAHKEASPSAISSADWIGFPDLTSHLVECQ